MVVNSESKHLVCDPAQPPAAEELLRWRFVHQPVPPLGRFVRHPEPCRPSNVLRRSCQAPKTRSGFQSLPV